MEFEYLKSATKRGAPIFLAINKIGLEHDEAPSSKTPIFTNLSNSLSTMIYFPW